MAEINLQAAVEAVQTLGSPAKSRGSVNYGREAQDENATPSNQGLIPQPGAARVAQQATDPFWVDEAIDPTRWDKRFPYQLLVLEAPETKAGRPVSSGGYKIDPMWSFTLPIPPEELTISTPAAVNVGATLGGIVEEHNGAVFRLINARGTTGVMPVRGTAATSTGVRDGQRLTGGLFAGTLQNAAQTIQTVSQQLGFPQANLMNQTELDVGLPGFSGRGTGYFQFHLLRVFWESYLAMKKRPEGRRKRLAFAAWKDRQVFLVTPVNFELRRSATDPLAYGYTLSMKAWRRVNLSARADVGAEQFREAADDPALLQSVLGGLLIARDTLESARGLISSVRGDIHDILDVGRQAALALKDAVGVALTLADLPEQIRKEAAGAGTEILSTPEDIRRAALERSRASRAARAAAPQSARTSGLSANGTPIARTERGDRLTQLASPLSKAFSSSQPDHALMSSLEVSQLQLKPSTRRRIQEESERARRLTRQDYELGRDKLLEFIVDYADACGAGSATYNSTYGRESRNTAKTPTDLDYDILAAANDMVMQLSHLAATKPRSSAAIQAIDVIAGLARRSGIAFKKPLSKFQVPWPYQATIEQVALRYLGDANRWIEIAALNGLRSPYVDEEGFDLPLLSDGSANEVVVADPTNLYVGQAVTVHSSSVPATRRRIARLEVIAPTMTIVHLDGDPDLDQYLVMASASLHTYLPDTVNSQQTIFIPSTVAVEDELTSRAVPGVNAVTGTIERGGVDLLLTTSGDMALTADGDWKLAIGVTNLMQRVKVAFGTPRGSLPQHPEFGLGLEVGMSTVDLDAKQLLDACRGMFASDPDFTGVTAARVVKNGPTVSVNLEVGVAGQEALLPVSMEVLR